MALTHPGRCPTPQAWHLASCDACDPIELSSWVSRVRAEGTRGTLTVTASALCCVPSITAPATRTPTAHSHRPCICQRAYKSPCLEGALEGWSVVAVISRQASLPGSRRAAPEPGSLPGSRRAAPEPGSLPGSRRAAPRAGKSPRIPQGGAPSREVSQDPAGRRRKQRVGEEGQRGRAEDAGLGRGDPAPSPAEGRGRPAAPGPACLGIPIAGSIINPPGSAGAGRQLPWLFGFSLLGAFQAPAGKQWPSRHASPAKGQDAEGRARPQRPGTALALPLSEIRHDVTGQGAS